MNAMLLVFQNRRFSDLQYVQTAISSAKEQLGDDTPVIDIAMAKSPKTTHKLASEFLKMVNRGQKVIGIIEGMGELDAIVQLHWYTKRELPNEIIDPNRWEYRFYPSFGIQITDPETGEIFRRPVSERERLIRQHIRW